jgi:hypothetical protein
MPTTRSQTSGVTKDDQLHEVSRSNKRKATNSQKAPAKKQKEVNRDHSDHSDTAATKESHSEDSTITINRAPVLELWASSVAHVLHPSLSWSTCLSIGGAISTIAAISKGRSIGWIDKPDPDKAADRKRKREDDGAEEVDVMGFNLHIDKDRHAKVGDKPRKGNEEALKKKYGVDQYERVKSIFTEALKSWEGKKDELNHRAFHMYEDFRPSVAAGQKGWGRKGTLDLEKVKKVVSDV